MKKFLFIALAAILGVINGQAQQSWDFTKAPSATDLANLAADNNWTIPTDKAYYSNTEAVTLTNEALKANNQELEYTKGLLFSGKATAADKVRITTDGKNGIWFAGQNYAVTIPNLKKGQKVTVTAKTGSSSAAAGLTPSNLNTISGFTATTDGQTNVGTVTEDGNVTLTSTANIKIFTIKVEEVDDTPEYNITVDPSENGSVTPDKTLAKVGETVTMAINPAEGYELNTLNVYYETTIPVTQSDGGGITSGSSARKKAMSVSDWVEVQVSEDYTFTMPAGPVTIVATFKEKGTTPVVTHTLTVAKEWVTFCSPITFKVPTGLKAYVLTAITAPKTGITGEIEVAEESYIVANQPMLIQNTTDNLATTEFQVTEAEGSLTNTPCTEYKGSTSTQEIAAGTYILYNGNFLRTNGGTLAAYNCYLDLSSKPVAGARRFSIVNRGDGTTDIQTIGNAELSEDNQWYTLNGVRIDQPTQKGVYIKNGKKFIVK